MRADAVVLALQNLKRGAEERTIVKLPVYFVERKSVRRV